MSRRIFAPLVFALGAFVMLFQGLRLLFSNWRLTLVQVLPAMWIWIAMLDLKAHVFKGKEFQSWYGWAAVALVAGIALFAVGGLITAAGGVYALLAYTVVQRRREIALRMALGASPRRVARSILTESLLLASAGGAIGLAGAAASGRFARTLLFGVAPQDPFTLVTSVAVLLVVVVAASWLPARRAALIDPGRAMRV